MRQQLSRAVLISSLALCTLTGGCLLVAAGAAGAGAYIYVNGEYTETVDVSFARAWDATVAAVNELGFRVKTKEADSIKGSITADEADGTNVWITVTASGENATKFVVRVGVAGSESGSRMVMERIKSKL